MRCECAPATPIGAFSDARLQVLAVSFESRNSRRTLRDFVELTRLVKLTRIGRANSFGRATRLVEQPRQLVSVELRLFVLHRANIKESQTIAVTARSATPFVVPMLS